MKRMILALALASLLGTAGAGSAGEAPGAYRLGPQDRLMIRVNTLRKSVGEAYSWTALSGEFTVGPDGSVSMPILGELTAAGDTAVALADLIGRTFQEKAGLTERPSAAVEVIRYRPFFVIGAVQRPGQYEYQPNLTVLQSLGIAQGFVRADDLAGIEKDKTSANGELRALGAERIGLTAKLARLTAELDRADAVVYPADLAAQTFDSRAVDAMREESLRFKVRRDAREAELAAIRQSRVLLEREIASLGAKQKALDRQSEMTNKELLVVRDLVKKGVAVTSRQLAAESAQITVESSLLDLQVASLRAQQAMSQADRDLVEIPARYYREAVDEAVLTRTQLEHNTEQLRTAEELLTNAELRSPGAGAAKPAATYTLTRDGGSGPTTTDAKDTDRIEPGDVLQVFLGPADRSRSVASSEPKPAN